jgi:hypothetical protein
MERDPSKTLDHARRGVRGRRDETPAIASHAPLGLTLTLLPDAAQLKATLK